MLAAGCSLAAVLPATLPTALLLVVPPSPSRLLVASEHALCSLYKPLLAQATMLSWLAAVRTLSSSKVKPRPYRFFMLYRTVWPCTTGLRAPATGLGNTLAALAARAAVAQTVCQGLELSRQPLKSLETGLGVPALL